MGFCTFCLNKKEELSIWQSIHAFVLLEDAMAT